jgi:hypothetical protein
MHALDALGAARGRRSRPGGASCRSRSGPRSPAPRRPLSLKPSGPNSLMPLSS